MIDMQKIDRIMATARRDARCVSASELRVLCDEIDRLRPYELAMQRMATQIVCPTTTAEQLAGDILKDDASETP